MSSSRRRRSGGSNDPDMVVLVIALAVITALAAAYLSWRVGHWLSGPDDEVFPANPATAVMALGKGQLSWPLASTILFALALIAGFVGGIAFARHRSAGAVLRGFDDAAVDMANARELSGVRARDARKSATRLLGRRALSAGGSRDLRYGLHLGRLVRGPMLYMLWEWVGLVIAGPRSGKTMAYMIPMACQAPGPVFITSNKTDIYDHTRWVRDAADIPTKLLTARTPDPMVKPTAPTQLDTARAAVGTVRARWDAARTWHDRRTQQRIAAARVRGRIWLADLQQLASPEGQQWWWNPLWRIQSLADARELSSAFAGAETDASARTDAYFDGGAKELLALHWLAAAVGGGDVVHAAAWLGNPKVEVAQNILDSHGFQDAAAKLRTTANLTQKQRDGLYDMARRFVNVLTVPAYARSVVPPQRKRFDEDSTHSGQDLSHTNPQFDPMAFVASTDTMYALSKDSPGAPTPLTAALTDSIFYAATLHARRSGGRLPIPLVALLDEAANVCKLTELPNWYSHFGDRGIVVLTVLQSLSQAAKVWSHDQMTTLTDASNVYIYGGSSNNKPWLGEISELIGRHDVRRYSRSSRSGIAGDSSESWSSEPILDVADLKALPLERAIVSTSGNRMVATEKNYWWNGPYAEIVEASRRACKRARGEDPADREYDHRDDRADDTPAPLSTGATV